VARRGDLRHQIACAVAAFAAAVPDQDDDDRYAVERRATSAHKLHES
jgi:hypothetical protein